MMTLTATAAFAFTMMMVAFTATAAFAFTVVMVTFAATAAFAFTVVMVTFAAAAAAFAFTVVMVTFTATAAFAFTVVMVTFAATAAFAFTVVMVTFAAAAAFAFTVVMVTFAAAAAFTFIVVMMSAATTATFTLLVMMVTAAATFTLSMMVMMAAATTAATAVVRTRQRNGSKRFLSCRNSQTHAFEHGLVLFDAGHGKTVFGLSNTHAASSQGVDGFLHQVEVARDLEDRFHRSFDLVEATVFVNENVTNLQRTNFAQSIFDRLITDNESFGQLDTFEERQSNRLGTVKNRLGRFTVERKKFRDAHC